MVSVEIAPAIERYADSLAVPETTGNVDALPLYAGQSAGLLDTSLSASTVIEELTSETTAALDRAATVGACAPDPD